MPTSPPPHRRFASRPSRIDRILADTRMRSLVMAGILVGCLLQGCQRQTPPRAQTQRAADGGPGDVTSRYRIPASRVTSTPLVQRGSTAGKRFTSIPAEHSNIWHTSRLDMSLAKRFLYATGMDCGGVAAGDVDGDGRPDLFLSSGPGWNRLFRNLGDFQFDDITKSAGVNGGSAWGTGAAMVDIENDGDLDIYVCNYDAPNHLFINNGAGIFVDRAAEYGLDVIDACLMPAFCDYDRDGDLDLYLLMLRYLRPGGYPRRARLIQENGQDALEPELRKYYQLVSEDGELKMEGIGRPDRLFMNNGDGTFVDVSQRAGIRGRGDGLSATWWDYDGDGWPDLYVGNDHNTADRLYRNNGDGTFTDTIRRHLPHTSWFSMGADAGDLNNDGLLDFITADMSATTHFKQKTLMGSMDRKAEFLRTAEPRQYMRNALYVNTGTERFMELAYLSGLASTNWTWSVKFADFDSDRLLDAHVTNGVARSVGDSDHPMPRGRALVGRNVIDEYVDQPPRREKNLAFHNRGDLRFVEVASEWGLDDVGMSYGSAIADFDRDGHLDLVVMNLDAPVSIYRNQSTSGQRVLIRLVGQVSNRYGLGATVQAYSAGGQQVRQLKANSGFLGSDEPLVHFGFGDDATIDRLVIHWPSGSLQTLRDLAANRFYTIVEPSVDSNASAGNKGDESHPSTKPADAVSPKPMFAISDRFAGVTHRERPFDDYQRQPLLPYQHSQLGPGLAWGDIDGDGDDDLYVGGAGRGQAGRILRNNSPGFEPLEGAGVAALVADQVCEDMAALWIDADSDGDLDLYVVSGSSEFERESDALADRLYWNDGQGRLTPAAPGALPALLSSGSVATAADFDRDGDLDIFVGGRLIPGEYPLPPRSYLLRNEGGKFVDATHDAAPQLVATGLVTSAIWSDVDRDGWIDLLVTHEWGPVKLFRNKLGRLYDFTGEAGLADRLGWYNSIAARDLDGDQDIDYVVTNVGLNTKYHATSEKPALLYYGDFEGTGRMRLVEAEYEASILYPVRGRNCSTNAMPFLGRKFNTYRDFALAELDQIYTTTCLEQAHRCEANSLESGVLINDGRGKFEFRPLPRLAQAAPGFGVVVTEVNGDGWPDVYIAQNFFGPQPETGRMDGGLSLLLVGQGGGELQPVWPRESGLIVPGDAKALTTADLDGDHWPDFVVANNDGPLEVFINQAATAARTLAIRLVGPPGNPQSVGALVTLTCDDGQTQTAEVHAGGGYLSQSSPTLVFGLGHQAQPAEITVRWPDGRTSRHTPDDIQTALTIRQPQ